MSETRRVDVAVIGAGTAGLGARRWAEKHGASTVIIEGGVHGTTCARVGCMPSKLLIAAADAAHGLQRASLFGVHAGPRGQDGCRVDGPAVMRRVRAERDRFVGFVLEAVDRTIPAERQLRGHARFVGPTTLQVDDTRVEARAVVVATGSTSFIPPVLRDVPLLTNDDVFELEDLPASIAVIGAGVIGLELGQAFHRLGARTRILDLADKAGPATDPVVVESVRQVLGAELALSLGVRITAARRQPEGVELEWTDAGGATHRETFARVLAATGRRPNLAGLDLEKAGIALDERGLPRVDPRTAQAGESGVFIAGDVAGHRPLLHEASDEGQIAGANAARFAAGQPVRAHQRRTALTVVFTDPQIALVGRTFAELEKRGDFAVGEVDYDDQGRARVMGQNRGKVRIYGDVKRGRLLGAEMFGPAVEHTGHLLAWAVQARMDVVDTLQMPYYHPVVEEGIRTALRRLAANLKLIDPPEVRCIDCGPGA